jgi:hypothetical protein
LPFTRALEKTQYIVIDRSNTRRCTSVFADKYEYERKREERLLRSKHNVSNAKCKY